MTAQKRKSYDIDYKVKAVAFARSNSKEAAGRQFQVDPRRIREWCQQEEKLTELKRKTTKTDKRKRLDSAGSKVHGVEMEDLLIAWIED